MGMTIKYKLEIKKKREIIKHSIYYIHKTLTQEVISIYIISKFYRITHLLKKKSFSTRIDTKKSNGIIFISKKNSRCKKIFE